MPSLIAKCFRMVAPSPPAVRRMTFLNEQTMRAHIRANPTVSDPPEVWNRLGPSIS
jgi:hypothetical protein